MRENKVEEARKAINSVFNDRSVARSQTIESLEELANEIETMIDALRDDERRGATRGTRPR